MLQLNGKVFTEKILKSAPLNVLHYFKVPISFCASLCLRLMLIIL